MFSFLSFAAKSIHSRSFMWRGFHPEFRHVPQCFYSHLPALLSLAELHGQALSPLVLLAGGPSAPNLLSLIMILPSNKAVLHRVLVRGSRLGVQLPLPSYLLPE